MDIPGMATGLKPQAASTRGAPVSDKARGHPISFAAIHSDSSTVHESQAPDQTRDVPPDFTTSTAPPVTAVARSPRLRTGGYEAEISQPNPQTISLSPDGAIPDIPGRKVDGEADPLTVAAEPAECDDCATPGPDQVAPAPSPFMPPAAAPGQTAAAMAGPAEPPPPPMLENPPAASGMPADSAAGSPPLPVRADAGGAQGAFRSGHDPHNAGSTSPTASGSGGNPVIARSLPNRSGIDVAGDSQNLAHASQTDTARPAAPAAEITAAPRALAADPLAPELANPAPIEPRNGGTAGLVLPAAMRSAPAGYAISSQLETASIAPTPVRTSTALPHRATLGTSDPAKAAEQVKPSSHTVDATPLSADLVAEAITGSSAAALQGMANAASDQTAPPYMPVPLEIARTTAPQIATAIPPGPGEGRIELELDPPELGRIEIQFDITDQQLRAVVTAERPATGEMLRRHGDLLIQQLQRSGFTEIDLRFGRDNPSSRWFTAPYPGHPDGESAPTSNPRMEAVAASWRLRTGQEGLDLRF